METVGAEKYRRINPNLWNIVLVPGSVEEGVEHAGEGEHGEEGRVEVAGVLVALDPPVTTCHCAHVRDGRVRRDDPGQNRGVETAELLGPANGFPEPGVRADLGHRDEDALTLRTRKQLSTLKKKCRNTYNNRAVRYKLHPTVLTYKH